jgi:hypothetical protein
VKRPSLPPSERRQLDAAWWAEPAAVLTDRATLFEKLIALDRQPAP